MKILFISMPSIHVIRWIENLKDSGYELYWFDVMKRGHLDTFDEVQQFVGWEKRKLPYLKGEYYFSKKHPKIYEKIRSILEVTENEALGEIIQRIQPDVIHSFEMQSCSYPVLKVMNKHPNVKWVYSCWGSDLFYYQNISSHNNKIRQVLKRVDYLHTDCNRDFKIAEKLGFTGKNLGVIPGGTGYDLQQLGKYRLPLEQRKIILVKGYQHLFGRGLNVVKALENLKIELQGYEVVIFGAHQILINYIIDKNLPFRFYDRHGLNHQEVLELMGKSLIYIGNSISDGMSNTLLEAIVMGAFPIQSNPGGVSAEIIQDGKNGLLIEDPENLDDVIQEVMKVVRDNKLLEDAFIMNEKIARERLDYDHICHIIEKMYNKVK